MKQLVCIAGETTFALPPPLSHPPSEHLIEDSHLCLASGLPRDPGRCRASKKLSKSIQIDDMVLHYSNSLFKSVPLENTLRWAHKLHVLCTLVS